MVFVRKKRIKGNEYFYLVKTIRIGGKVNQITLKYLGTEIPTHSDIELLKQKYK